MSLVGTRPILQDELRQYELHHRARIAIKPGITGMWQVSGRSDIVIVVSILISILYSHRLLRYSFILIISLAAFIKRKAIIVMLRKS